jgi:hypothetical protein
MLSACANFRGSIGGCDTYSQWEIQYNLFDGRYNELNGKLDDCIKRNDNNVESWKSMITQMRSNVQNQEFYQFLGSNGKYIDDQMNLVNEQKFANTQEKDRLTNETIGIKERLHTAGANNDYPALKSVSYDWIDNLANSFKNIKKNLLLQSQMIQLGEITENAIVECQTYQ